MPLYEYRCAACSREFELLRPMDMSTAKADCPSCGEAVDPDVLSVFAACRSTLPVVRVSRALCRRVMGGGGCGTAGRAAAEPAASPLPRNGCSVPVASTSAGVAPKGRPVDVAVVLCGHSY